MNLRDKKKAKRKRWRFTQDEIGGAQLPRWRRRQSSNAIRTNNNGSNDKQWWLEVSVIPAE